MEIVPADRPGSFFVHLDDMPQSHVDLEDPTRLAIDYVRRLADLVDALPPGPLRVVHVGGAGMTLPRYVHARRPGSSQVVLEPDTVLTELVRTRLPLPRRSGIRVRPVDGRTGLDAVSQADLIVVDAFAEAQTPQELVTAEAIARMGEIAPTIAINLVDRAPFALVRRVIAALEDPALVAEEAVLKGRRAGNLVVAAGVAAPAIGNSVPGSTYRLLRGVGLRDRFGGGEPITDAEIGWVTRRPPTSADQTPRTSP